MGNIDIVGLKLNEKIIFSNKKFNLTKYFSIMIIKSLRRINFLVSKLYI